MHHATALTTALRSLNCFLAHVIKKCSASLRWIQEALGAKWMFRSSQREPVCVDAISLIGTKSHMGSVNRASSPCRDPGFVKILLKCNLLSYDEQASPVNRDLVFKRDPD